MPLALAEASLGDHENAVKNSQAVIDIFHSLGATGLNLGLAHETRARVALFMQNRDDFNMHASLCSEHYKTGENAVLTAKFEKLMQVATHARLGLSDVLFENIDLSTPTTIVTHVQITEMLDASTDPEERFKNALQVLVKRCRCLGGVLYTMQEEGLVLSAQYGQHARPNGCDALIRHFLSSHLYYEEDETKCIDEAKESSSDGSEWIDQEGQRHHPIIIGHYNQKRFVISGCAVLLLDPDEPLKLPMDTILSISKALAESGYVIPVSTSIDDLSK